MDFCCMNCLFCFVRIYNRLFYKKLPKQKVSTTNFPWLWVGVELNDGNIETITDVVNSAVDYGDIITSPFLQEITQIPNAKRWIYLHPITLNEEEFPAEGLVIKDDSDE